MCMRASTAPYQPAVIFGGRQHRHAGEHDEWSLVCRLASPVLHCRCRRWAPGRECRGAQGATSG